MCSATCASDTGSPAARRLPFNASSRRRASAAASSARSQAFDSSLSGKIASRPSPMNLSTCPPCASIVSTCASA